MQVTPQSAPTHEERSDVHFFSRYSVLSILLFIAVLAIGTSVGYTLEQQEGEVAGASTSTLSDQRDIAALMEKVGEHFVLPQGEQATIATVSDVTQLEQNDFFSHAHNGDKVIIYPQAGIAILYRPTLDKIVAVGPVTNEQQSTVQVTPVPLSITPSPQASESAQ